MSPVGHQTNDTSPLLLDANSNKEVPNIDVPHMLAAQSLPILSKRIVLLLSWNKTLS
jgi:hypothetical protein